MKQLTRLASWSPWLLAALVVVPTVMAVPAFRRADYWLDLCHQSFAMTALALALTPIIITGGIDLSVGSVSVLASVVVGFLWQDLGWPIGWALAGGVGVGLLAGLANGLMVSLSILPLVATLATRELFRGLAFTLSGDAPVSGFPVELESAWRTPVLGVPWPLLVILLLFVLTYVLVHHTWIGRMIYAIGDNEQAARFAGVPIRGIKLGLYAWSGFVAGLCGAASVLEYLSARAGADKSLELAAIAVVVLGGIRITGGAGSVTGTLIGAVTLTTLLGGLLQAAPDWRETITGVLLIVVAVANEAAGRWGDRSRAVGPAQGGGTGVPPVRNRRDACST